MTLYTEIEWAHHRGGIVKEIEPGSVAAEVGLLPGDQLLAVNGNKVQDIIDVRFYGAEEILELFVRRGEEQLIFEAERDYHQSLGIIFQHSTFDIDIRRCNNLCEFCFVLQMAPRFRRSLYIKDDDYRYSFLHGHFVTLTNLNDHDWQRIEKMGLSPLYISVHVTDLELRRGFLRNNTAPDIMEQLRWLADRNISFHTQIVVVPGMNDGKWLERTVDDLASLWPSTLSVSVVPVGLTSHHKYSKRKHTVQEAADLLDDVETLQYDFFKKFGQRFVYCTDEWYLVTGRQVPTLTAYDGHQLEENGLGMVRRFLNEWHEVRREIKAWHEEESAENQAKIPALESITLVTATLFEQTLQSVANEFSALTETATHVVTITNQRLGDTITVAGLLMVHDIIDQLLASTYGDLIILPQVTFDHPDVISLDDLSPQTVANRLGETVVLGDQMGDVWDAWLGQSLLIFHPQ